MYSILSYRIGASRYPPSSTPSHLALLHLNSWQRSCLGFDVETPSVSALRYVELTLRQHQNANNNPVQAQHLRKDEYKYHTNIQSRLLRARPHYIRQSAFS